MIQTVREMGFWLVAALAFVGIVRFAIAEPMVWQDGPTTRTETRTETWVTKTWTGPVTVTKSPRLVRTVQNNIEVMDVRAMGRDGIRATLYYRGRQPLGALTIAASLPGYATRVEAAMPVPVLEDQMLVMQVAQPGSRIGLRADEVVITVVDAAPYYR